MFNSLIMVLDGTTYVFECHSYRKAMEILSHNWNMWESQEKFPVIDSFQLV